MTRRVFQGGKLRNACVLNLFLSGLTLMVASTTYAQEEAPPPPDAVPMPADDAAMPAAEGATCDTCNSGCATDGCKDPCDWCDLGEKWLLSDRLFSDPCGCDEEPPFTVGGWTQWGYHSESNGLFNNHDSQIQNHQSWLYMEKVANGECGFDWGFRGDLMYGTDAQDTQAFGEPAPQDHWDNPWDHGIYGWALPQLYAEFAYHDLSVKAGHFYTIVGYEVVQATGNFFYSHSYTQYNSEPFTHTGALATYAASDNLEVYGGWTAGWDTGFDRFSDGDNSKGSNFLGGFKYTVSDNLSVSYITTAGDLGTRGEGYSHDIIIDATLTENLNYVIVSDLVDTNTRVFNNQVGVDQYLIYTYNDCLGFGGRMEWWKNDGNSQYAATLGVNYWATANLVIRPEVRHDWNPGGARFNGDGKNNFTTFGVDAVLSF